MIEASWGRCGNAYEQRAFWSTGKFQRLTTASQPVWLEDEVPGFPLIDVTGAASPSAVLCWLPDLPIKLHLKRKYRHTFSAHRHVCNCSEASSNRRQGKELPRGEDGQRGRVHVEGRTGCSLEGDPGGRR